MKFKLTPMFTEADIRKELDAFFDRVKRVIKSELDYLAMDMVTYAWQQTKSAGDRTEN
ncbi:MAG: hypothetical protein H7Y13_13810 [Sphingobacteriaceae bacterium]|nr:hypothetical protein [Sphingobacteriaceae bacterium]